MAKSGIIKTGPGDDEVFTSSIADVNVKSGAGNDRLIIDFATTARLDLGPGNDTLVLRGSSIADVRGGSGDDTITVAPFYSGVTTIDAGPGADFIDLRFATANLQTVRTGPGSDVVVAPGFVPNGLVITDFSPGVGGDALTLWLQPERPGQPALLTDWDGTSDPFDSGHLRLSQVGADAVLEVDRDGAVNGISFTPIVVLQDVLAASITDANLVLLPSFQPPASIESFFIQAPAVDV